MNAKVAKLVQKLIEEQGFDNSYVSGEYAKPRCSQCQAMVINGMACHETGCPNAPRCDSDGDDDYDCHDLI